MQILAPWAGRAETLQSHCKQGMPMPGLRPHSARWSSVWTGSQPWLLIRTSGTYTTMPLSSSRSQSLFTFRGHFGPESLWQGHPVHCGTCSIITGLHPVGLGKPRHQGSRKLPSVPTTLNQRLAAQCLSTGRERAGCRSCPLPAYGAALFLQEMPAHSRDAAHGSGRSPRRACHRVQCWR